MVVFRLGGGELYTRFTTVLVEGERAREGVGGVLYTRFTAVLVEREREREREMAVDGGRQPESKTEKMLLATTRALADNIWPNNRLRNSIAFFFNILFLNFIWLKFSFNFS